MHEDHTELAGEEWKLAPQVEALERWLRQNASNIDKNCCWSADIGFGHRPEATGGGAVISHELMLLCIESRMELFLSEYAIEAK